MKAVVVLKREEYEALIRERLSDVVPAQCAVKFLGADSEQLKVEAVRLEWDAALPNGGGT